MFKINKTIAHSFSAVLLLTSCAKYSSNDYTSVDKPETVVVQEEIDAYPELKALKASNAGFKLGMALSSTGYVNQDVTYRFAERNFDELVLETEMRHGAVVLADGSLDLTGVKKFLTVAKEAGKSVYGNALTWHTAQNSTYLNALITGASGVTTINFESDAVGKSYPMTGNSTAVVELDPKGGGSKVLHIGSAATPANQSFPKIDVTLPAGIKLGNCSQLVLDILAPGSGGLFGSGMRLGINNRALTVYGSPSSFGAADNVWLTGGKVILPFSNLNLTAEEKELTTFTLVFGSGTGSGNYYMDNVIISWNAQKSAEEKKTIITGALNKFIAGMIDTCKSAVTAWDVVKEPIDDANPAQLKTGVGKTLAAGEFYWQDYMGYDYGVTAFQFARQHANATDKLFVNDNNLESNLNKCRGLITYVQYIESKGAKVDGIGTQMHIDINTSKENIAEHFRLLAATGKLIKISELDISLGGVKTPQATSAQYVAQAEMYQYVLEKYFELIPAAQRYGITFWSPFDRSTSATWKSGEPVGVWRENLSRKLSYKAVADVIKTKTGQ